MHWILDKIHGLFITGGWDLDPKYYGQTNKGSICFKEGNLRFMFTKTLIEEAPKELPILATCWGYEVLNVIFGGTLV